MNSAAWPIEIELIAPALWLVAAPTGAARALENLAVVCGLGLALTLLTALGFRIAYRHGGRPR